MKIIFRTDASLQLGTGHVMRCLTLAGALHDRGALCRFICREEPGNLIKLIRRRGFEVIPLPIEDGQDIDWHTDAEQTKVGVGETAADWLIVDHYALDARWERALRPYCRKLMVIDDLADRTHHCDLLLDQNLVANLDDRYRDKVPPTCCLLLGPEYVLMQPAYGQLHDKVLPRSGPIKRLLVYFGGADTANLTGMTIAAFASLERSDIALDVVINSASPYSTSIRQQMADLPHATIHGSLPTLAPLIMQADLAIGAGGTTTWERLCLGLPSLVVSLAENQEPVAAELDRRKIVRWLGKKGAVTLTDIADALASALDNPKHTSWAERCHNFVDGRGVERVIQQMSMADS